MERQNGVFNYESYQVISWRLLLRANHFPGTEKDLSKECTSRGSRTSKIKSIWMRLTASTIDTAMIIMNTYFYKHYLIYPFQELYESSTVIILLSPFYRWGNWSKGRFNNCPRWQQERVEPTRQFDLRILVFKITWELLSTHLADHLRSMKLIKSWFFPSLCKCICF